MLTPCCNIPNEMKCCSSTTGVNQSKNNLRGVLYNEALGGLYNDIPNDLDYDLPNDVIQNGTTGVLHNISDNLCNAILCGQINYNQDLLYDELVNDDKPLPTINDLKKTKKIFVTSGR